MANVKGITVELGINTDKVQHKLRAIAKHVGALADELDAIDNSKPCPHCGSLDVRKYYIGNDIHRMMCNDCDTAFAIDDGLPTGG